MLPIAIVAVLISSGYVGVRNRTAFRYMEHLDDVAVYVDGDALTLRDLLFYVAYEEMNVEEDARAYNPDNTIEYWNIHTNGSFFKDIAKDAAIGMAIHDHLLFKEAQAADLILTSDERMLREEAKDDFWSDLTEHQTQVLSGYEDVVNDTIDRVAMVEKYAKKICSEEGISEPSYEWNGENYEKYQAEHEIEINKKVWDKVVLGDITLEHPRESFLPTEKKKTKENSDESGQE